MSQIDESLPAEQRVQMLSEIREYLPAFLSSASIERDDPVKAAVALLNLPESDLRRVLAIHIMLAHPIRELVAALPRGIRRPLTASARPRVAGRTVTSGIDWAATARQRATSSPTGDVWVTRPAARIFDTPENRVLAWVLQRLEERAAIAAPVPHEASGAWWNEIQMMMTAVHRARQTAWLNHIPTSWPGDEAYFSLEADRTGFYRIRVAEAARYLRPLLTQPSADDIVEALSQRYFEPRQDWKLFEVAVLLRIAKELNAVGRKTNSTSLFHATKGRPFAVYNIGSARQVRVWYQTWPPASAPSELIDAINHYELPPSITRPDIVVEVVSEGRSERALLLELKASSSRSYLASGFSQLLGYLRDRPKLLKLPASAWLVAPPSTSYAIKPPGGRSLWITSSDAVALEVRRTVTEGPATSSS